MKTQLVLRNPLGNEIRFNRKVKQKTATDFSQSSYSIAFRTYISTKFVEEVEF